MTASGSGEKIESTKKCEKERYINEKTTLLVSTFK